MPPKGYRKPAKRTYRKKRTYKRKPTVSTAVKSYVKKTIHGAIENKCTDFIALNQPLASLTGFSTPLCPYLNQGTTQGTRIGNEIRIVKGTIKVMVNLLPYNAVSNPFITQRVRILVLSLKDQNSTFNATGIWQYGASSLNLQANLGDIMYSVNKELYTVYMDRNFELSSPSQSSLTNNTAGQHFSNSPFQRSFNIDFGKYMKQKLKYNDTTNVPTNRNMFLFIQSVNADGSSTAVTPVEVHYLYHCEYEDA